MLFDNLVLFTCHILMFKHFEFVLCTKICRRFLSSSPLKKRNLFAFTWEFCSYFSHIHFLEETKWRKDFILKEIFWNVHLKKKFILAQLNFCFKLSNMRNVSQATWIGVHCIFWGHWWDFCIIFIIILREIGLEGICPVDAVHHIAGFLPTYYCKV